MQPVTIHLSNHTKGDTWEGLKREVPLLFDGGAPPADLAACRMYVRTQSGIVILKFKTTPGTGEETITINNAITWLFTVEPTIIDIPNASYYWDLETTDVDGAVRTLYNGIWAITKEQSHD